MIYGTVAAYGVASPAQRHFGGSAKEIPGIGEIGYIGLTAFVLNVVVTVALTFVLKAVKAPECRVLRRQQKPRLGTWRAVLHGPCRRLRHLDGIVRPYIEPGSGAVRAQPSPASPKATPASAGGR